MGFGDDVAVSAGLLCWDERHFPAFVGDAIADPLTGVYAALAVIDAMAQGESGLLDSPWSRLLGDAVKKLLGQAKAIARCRKQNMLIKNARIDDPLG